MEVGGVLFFAAISGGCTKSGCSVNDGAGKLFWCIKNLSSSCFLMAIKFFVILSVKFNANMLSASR